MSAHLNGSISNGTGNEELPKRPDIPRTSGNFFQSLPAPPQLPQYNVPQPFSMFGNRQRPSLPYLPFTGITGTQPPSFSPFSAHSDSISDIATERMYHQPPHTADPYTELPASAPPHKNGLLGYPKSEPASASHSTVSVRVSEAFPPEFAELSSPSTKFTQQVAHKQQINPYIYPQESIDFKNPNFTARSVDANFNEIRSCQLDQNKKTDPLKFLDENYQKNECAISIATTKEWQAKNLGKVPKSLWIKARQQIFNPKSDEEQRSIYPRSMKLEGGSKIPSFENVNLDLFRLKNLVEMRGGVNRVDTENLWRSIGKELGYLTDASQFLKNEYNKTISKYTHAEISIKDEINGNNKRELDQIKDRFEQKKLKTESSVLPIIASSSYEYRRTRKHLVLKGYASLFDKASINRTGVTDSENSLFEEWVQKKKELIDSSIFDNSAYFTLDECIEKDLCIKDYLEISSTQTIEELEMKYWQFLESGEYLEITSALRMLNGQSIFPNTVSINDSPWNLNNISQNNHSLLKYASEEIESLSKPSLSVGMLFSTENWTMEDHLLPLLDYLHIGEGKIWYFVEPEDTEKLQELMKLMGTKMDSANLNIRGEHIDQFFNRYTTQDGSTRIFNTDYLITPSFLKLKGIKVRKVLQRPGEFILKFPGTFSYSVSMGFNVSESINFMLPLWLDFAVGAERVLALQGIMANFSVFEILTNIAKNCNNPSLVAKANDIYVSICEEEISLRDQVRSLVPELSEKLNKNIEFYLSDDDLSNSFPSVMCLISKQEHQISMSLRNFLQQYGKDKSKFDNNIVHFELLVMYEDDKLRQFSKTLARDITTSFDWSQKLELSLKDESKPSFKLLKQLFSEGEKIFTNEYLSTVYNEETELEHYERYLQLGEKVEEFGAWIELAQKFLTSKHLSRKRKGRKDDEEEATSADIGDLKLSSLCKLIEQIPNLSFFAEEMDQLVNLTMEIEDYEVSARKFISTIDETRNLEELRNLLSLGKSFGIADIQSVLFLKEYEETESWLTTFKECKTVGVVLAFENFDSLQSYLQLGNNIKTVKEKHLEKLLLLEELCRKTIAANELGNKILNKSHRASDIEEINRLVHDAFEYPVDSEMRNELVRLQAEYEEISLKSNKFIEAIEEARKLKDTPEFLALLESMPKFQQIKSLLDKSHSLRIIIPDVKRLEEEYFKRSEDWLRSLRRLLHRQNSSASNLKNYLTTITENVRTTIGNQSDEVLIGSEDEPSSNENIYCICRQGESGLMVECETCSEWYHLGCFNLNKVKMKNKSFVCPICDENGEHKELYENMKVQYRPDSADIVKIIENCADLKYLPLEEYQDLQQIYQILHKFLQNLRDNLHWQGSELQETNIHKIRFYLRKLIGCPIDIKPETSSLQSRLKKLLELQKKELQKLLETNRENSSNVETAETVVQASLPVQEEIKEVVKNDQLQIVTDGPLENHHEITTTFNEKNEGDAHIVADNNNNDDKTIDNSNINDNAAVRTQEDPKTITGTGPELADMNFPQQAEKNIEAATVVKEVTSLAKEKETVEGERNNGVAITVDNSVTST